MNEQLEKLQVNLRQLKQANQRLNEALEQPFNEFIRDSVIQRFEFTFELAWKTMKIALKFYSVYENTPSRILKEALKAKIIDDLDTWEAMLEGRNSTSHVYNEGDAQTIYDQIQGYPPYFKKLIDSLSEIQ